MKITLKHLLYFTLAATTVSCKKPYEPKIISSAAGSLVIEGIINSSGHDTAIIKLSRTIPIKSDTLSPESNAIISLEGDNGYSYPLYEFLTGVKGTYATDGEVDLSSTNKWRLYIKTNSGREYFSDYVPVTKTPPIDSVGYNLTPNGIQIYINTHDPNNKAKYYRWDFEETWEFHANYHSVYYVKNDSILVRPGDQQVYSCFNSDRSSGIILGSSADLTQDVIYQNPITTIDQNSEKLETKYSIIIHQYALTGEAFSFWTNLKKNTEQLGSIFDAQPSQLAGNFHCISNPAEPVIGYFSITNIQNKRIYITNGQLPNRFLGKNSYNCQEDTNLYYNPKTKSNDVQINILEAPPGAIDVTSAIYQNGFVVGYLSSIPICADCTLRGNTNPPAFWK